MGISKETEIPIKPNDIYPKQGFCDEAMITPEDGSTTREAAEEPREIATWDR